MQSGVQATQQCLMAKYIMQLKRKLHSECCSMGYYSQLRAEVSFSLSALITDQQFDESLAELVGSYKHACNGIGSTLKTLCALFVLKLQKKYKECP